MRIRKSEIELKKIEKRIKVSTVIAVGLSIGISISYFIWFYLTNGQVLSKNSSDWGTFGDFIGGLLNPIIAFFAFYWLTRSVMIQKQELSETQYVLEKTSESNIEQAKTLEKRRFEDSFYALLNQQNLIFASLNQKIFVQDKSQPSVIEKVYKNVFDDNINTNLILAIQAIKKESSSCGHFFRILYQLLKFILLSAPRERNSSTFEGALNIPVTSEEKFYSNIVRSFLNEKTTALLAINCCTNDKNDTYYKYRKLVERYSMFEHISFNQSRIKDAAEIYDASAFGNNSEYNQLFVSLNKQKERK